MPEIDWTTQLELGVSRMDNTHREFVEHYNALANAAPEDFLAHLDTFIEHTEAHFAQENRWMEQVNFPGCHRGEHERVLEVVREVRRQAANGEMLYAGRLIEELPAWFENHTNGMDAALAFHLQTIGFDFEKESVPDTENTNWEGGCTCAPPDKTLKAEV